MKSQNEITKELLNRRNVKELKDEFYLFSGEGLEENSWLTLLNLIVLNSNDFTKDIATKFSNFENIHWELSEKQSWCLAYQIINNIEVYKQTLIEYSDECKKLYN